MFLIAFNKMLLTLGYFSTILSHFHKMRQSFCLEKQLAASQFFQTLPAQEIVNALNLKVSREDKTMSYGEYVSHGATEAIFMFT